MPQKPHSPTAYTGLREHSGALRAPQAAPPHGPAAPAQRPPGGACGHGAAGQSQPQGAALRPAAEVARPGLRDSAGAAVPAAGPQPARGGPLVAVPALPFASGRAHVFRRRPPRSHGAESAAAGPAGCREGLGSAPCRCESPWRP